MTLQIRPQGSPLGSIQRLEEIGDSESRRQLGALLANESGLARLRVQAARSLERLGDQETLIRHVNVQDESARAAVLLALGKIGNAEALKVVERAQAGATGRALRHGRFAAALISHRLRLEGHDLPEPSEEVLEPATDLQPFEVRSADKESISEVVRGLAHEPFGISYSHERAVELRCERRSWMILLNNELATERAFESLHQRKALVGVVASRLEATLVPPTYSVHYLILFSPKSERAPLVLYTPSGKATHAGTARVHEGGMDFRLRALLRPGALGIKLGGTFGPAGLRATEAATSLSVQPRKEPASEASRALPRA